MIEYILNALFGSATSSSSQRNSDPDNVDTFQLLPTAAIVTLGSVYLIGWSINRYLKHRYSEQSDPNIFALLTNEKSPKLKKLEDKFAAQGFFIKECDGRSLIFVNQDMPQILVKHPGVYPKWSPISRYNHQQQVKQFIEQKGFRHLVVPKIKVEEDYLIEDKLPINGSDIREQIELYIKHIDCFTQAAEEFAILLFIGEFTDLIGGYWRRLSSTEIPRYDNAILYLEHGDGKIGLIDVESLYIGSESELSCKDIEGIFKRCKIAVTFFPHHLNQIIAQAEKFNKDITEKRSELQDIQKKILDFFDTIYGVHARFLQHHHITEENANFLIDINPILEDEITNLLVNKYNNSSMDAFSLSEEPDQDNNKLDSKKDPQNIELKLKFFPVAVNETLAFNKKRYQYALSKENGLKNKSLLNLRTSIFSRRSIPPSGLSEYDQNEKLLHPILEGCLSEMNITCNIYFLTWLTDTIYEILVDKQLIAGFHKDIYGKLDCVFF